ncbi:hypothetical protein HYH02_000848 [Chlamydomonas schloesseri]|uniref:Uncharacterized protein n=1 Tax=Chlamydomonas schloesseri TaxID=2026947 RepID=A0A835WVE5_9CHLO|nr:hypothetical protein HYH02_000848 [Chlamydomonas schloesseri]|eukprot:KAG2455023.1 hypothetical protein HYH02_000848 [Chlamydomonas schloesseri]
MKALEPLQFSSELEAFYRDQASAGGTGQPGRLGITGHLLWVILVAACWCASADPTTPTGPHVWLGAVAYVCVLLGHEALLGGLAAGRQRFKLREWLVALLRIALCALYPICAAGLARTLGLGDSASLGGTNTTFMRWPGRGLLRGQIQRLVEPYQDAIRTVMGFQGGRGGWYSSGGSGCALLWHLLVSSGALHQSMLALALPLSFRTHLAVTLISSIVMNLFCNDAACVALGASPQLRQQVGAAASHLSHLHGIIAAPGPFGGGILLPASVVAFVPVTAGAEPVAPAAALLAASRLPAANSSLCMNAAEAAGTAAAAETAASAAAAAAAAASRAAGGRPAGLHPGAWSEWGLPSPAQPSTHELAAAALASGASASAGLAGQAAAGFYWPGCWAVVSFVQVLLAVGVTSTVVYFSEGARRQAFVDRVRDLQQGARKREMQAPAPSEAGPSGSCAAPASLIRHPTNGPDVPMDEMEDLLPRLVLPAPPEHDWMQYAAKAVLIGLLGLVWWDALLIMKAATLQLA